MDVTENGMLIGRPFICMHGIQGHFPGVMEWCVFSCVEHSGTDEKINEFLSLVEDDAVFYY